MASAVVTIQGDLTGRFDLDPGRGLVLGRSLTVDLSVDDLRVSRRHCRVELGEHGVQVTDLQSANGTYVNGRRVNKAVVRTGDTVQVGNVSLTLQVDYRGENPLTREERCSSCGRTLSLATITDGDVIQIEEKFICPQCREKQQTPAFSVIELGIVQRLYDEGFEVLEKLSISGLVPIFRAMKRSLEQMVAIKALPLAASVSQKKIARFVQEAKAEARLRHPNIVTIYDVRRSKDLLYIVMELIDGVTLLQEIERTGRMATRDAVRVAYQVAKALAHAFEKKIVHRDVKPQNIMVTREGDSKLIDFGLAKNLWEVAAGNITGDGETLGTVGYMAPEQVKNAKRADHRADIYGLGATLYHCLSGRPPFVEKNEKSLASAIAECEPPPLDRLGGVPLNVVAIVARMMQKRPEDRYATAEDVMRAIENVVGEMLGIEGARSNVEFLLRLRDEELDLQRTWRTALRPPTAVHGAFRGGELIEFLQMVEFNQKTGVLDVAGRAVRGRVYISYGKIIAAEAFRLKDLGKSSSGEENAFERGPKAVETLLAIESGDFEFAPKEINVEKECELKISKVLLDVLKQREERSGES